MSHEEAMRGGSMESLILPAHKSRQQGRARHRVESEVSLALDGYISPPCAEGLDMYMRART